MSFKSKIDFCGLADGTTIKLLSHSEGRSSTVVTCENDEGDTVDATVCGHVMDPSNDYALCADLTDFEIVLGSVRTVNFGTNAAPDNHHFALKSVSIGTSNGGKVTLSASAVEVPSDTAGRTYTVTISSLKCRNKAQILNSLFTLTGDKCHLQSASYEIAAQVEHTTVDAERAAFDVYGASIVVGVEAKQAGSVAPVVAPGTSDTLVTILSGDNDESRPDSDYASISAEVTRYLIADAA